ncbi:MAG: cysteine synthase A [Clostridia bacterium]|nr:cysteine synthase A [Clostridia bacterium]
MNIYRSISELVGKTPLLEMVNYEENNALEAKIFAKVEFFNPAGSSKDRVAKQMIEDAEKKGILKKGATIIEPTSGNTGIGLCAIAKAKGYKCIIIMPDTMSQERRNLMRAYGAELVLTDGKLGMKGAIEKSQELAKTIDGSFIPSQFTNKSNPEAHKITTGPEIWQDTEGSVDIFVACVGTGGTLSGVGEYLKNKNKNIKIIAVEPHSSPLLSKGETGSHKIQGIGANFIPETLNREIYDEIITVTDDDAYEFSRQITENEGLLVGISSGAAFCAAVELAKRKENKNKNIVVLFPDSGERYLSTPNFIK